MYALLNAISINTQLNNIKGVQRQFKGCKQCYANKIYFKLKKKKMNKIPLFYKA